MNNEATNAKHAPPFSRATDVTAWGIPSGFKRTEVGVIPENWSARSLGEIGDCLIGLTYEPSNVRPDGLLVLRASNIGDGGLQFGDNVFVDVDVPARLFVQPDDLLICVRNGSRRLIGKCALLDSRAEGMTFGAFMSVFRSDYNHFIAYCFQSHIIKRQIHQHLGATINQITNKSLKSFIVPLPPFPERNVIAEALSDVDALLDGLDRLIAKKRDLKQAAMQELLTGQTRLPGFCGEWKVKRLRNLLAYERPDRYIVKSTEYADDGDVPVLTANKSFILGYTIETFGVCTNLPAIVFDDFTTDRKFVTVPFKVKSSAIKLLRPRHERTSLRFLFERMQLIRFPVFDHRRYYISDYQNMRLPIPEYDEQLAVIAVFADMDAEIAALEARRDKTQALKEGMMQELLIGKTRLVKPGVAHA